MAEKVYVQFNLPMFFWSSEEQPIKVSSSNYQVSSHANAVKPAHFEEIKIISCAAISSSLKLSMWYDWKRESAIHSRVQLVLIFSRNMLGSGSRSV